MTSSSSRRLLRALATLIIFTGFAGQFWRNLLGWWGYGAIVVVVTAIIVILLIRLRPWQGWRRTPKTLVAFLGLAVLSIAWSYYPGASALGASLQLITTAGGAFLGLCIAWDDVVRAFGSALRWMLGLSLVFEAWVALVLRHELLPFFGITGEPPYPQAFYWSRGLLLHGGPIEGIVANRNLLGFIALLGIIVFAIQLAGRSVRRSWGIFWLVVAAVVFLLTRSTTVIIAAIAVAFVLAFALWARRIGDNRRRPVYLTAIGIAVVVTGLILTLQAPLLRLFGKSEDLTGRFDIWNSVIHLAQQRPVFGWGWVSYWAPWVAPFDDLAVRKGVVYLQAHDAWLDVWLQLGIVGLVIFIAFVASTLWRSWFVAIDQPWSGPAQRVPYTASSLLPLLLMAALIAQSIAESRLIIEGGWITLVAISFATKKTFASPGVLT